MVYDNRSWHKRWLALDDLRRRLLNEWCVLNRQLEGRAGWFALSDVARAAVEQDAGLSGLDTTLTLIHRHLRRWLRAVPTDIIDDVADVAASLQVAERLLPVEENHVAHLLIAQAVRDLSRMQEAA